jgi:hypothetical protein
MEGWANQDQLVQNYELTARTIERASTLPHIEQALTIFQRRLHALACKRLPMSWVTQPDEPATSEFMGRAALAALMTSEREAFDQINPQHHQNTAYKVPSWEIGVMNGARPHQQRRLRAWAGDIGFRFPSQHGATTHFQPTSPDPRITCPNSNIKGSKKCQVGRSLLETMQLNWTDGKMLCVEGEQPCQLPPSNSCIDLWANHRSEKGTPREQLSQLDFLWEELFVVAGLTHLAQ